MTLGSGHGGGGEGVLYRWDGKSFEPMECPGKILSLHGTSASLLFAVGEGGLIAHWDGSSWHQQDPGVRTTLSSVWVGSAEEAYATGKSGEILEGSVQGWSLRLRHEGSVRAVAKWKDRLWVAAGGEHGLSEVVDDEVRSLKPNLLATRLDARSARAPQPVASSAASTSAELEGSCMLETGCQRTTAEEGRGEGRGGIKEQIGIWISLSVP